MLSRNTSSAPKPSTAVLSAAARAAHLVVDHQPVIFEDSLAEAILGADGAEPLGYHRAMPAASILVAARTEATCRARFAEDRLAASAIAQYVVLGAGYDTYAYRTRLAPDASVYEVDLPLASETKQTALRRAGIPVPDAVQFVPADLASNSLGAGLAAAGFDARRPAFVSALGLTMYVSQSTLGRLLTELAQLGPGTRLVADFLLPPDHADARAYSGVGEAAATIGEAWRSYFTPEGLSSLVSQRGFTTATTLSQRESIPEALWSRSDGLRPMSVSGLLDAAV
jgi:methyltransferase (TIGR00027 family)